jgi:hypothetical protein
MMQRISLLGKKTIRDILFVSAHNDQFPMVKMIMEKVMGRIWV